MIRYCSRNPTSNVRTNKLEGVNLLRARSKAMNVFWFKQRELKKSYNELRNIERKLIWYGLIGTKFINYYLIQFRIRIQKPTKILCHGCLNSTYWLYFRESFCLSLFSIKRKCLTFKNPLKNVIKVMGSKILRY